MASANEFHLPDNLTILQAQILHDQFESLVDDEACEQLIVHGKSVERTDTAGLQLLLALVQAARERQIALVWDKPSDNLLASAATLGLTQALGLH